MKKLLTILTALTVVFILTALIVVSCQPAMADQKYTLKDDAFFCEQDFVLKTVESNRMKGLSMSNDRYFRSGLCKVFYKDTEIELSKWPIHGSSMTMLNVRVNGSVYVTRKFYMETKIETSN